MSKQLLTNKFFLIFLGLVALTGLVFVGFNATRNSTPQASTASPTASQPKTATMPPPVKDTPVSGQIIVKFKPQYSDAQINAHLQQYHASIIKTIEGINQTVIKVPKGQEDTVSLEMKSDPYVETVQRDYTTHAFFVPNDTEFSQQYGLNNSGQSVQGQAGTPKADIHAEAAWDITQGTGVKVAILDTGINLNQPDLAGKVILQKSFVSNTVEDGSGHGTHVAGIIAADTNNSSGVAGTCPGCQLIIGKILDDSGDGTTSNATAGITWAADNGAKVINMSLGTTDPSTASLYNQAVAYAMSKGALVVAAAGNDGTDELDYPAAATGVIAVAGTDNNDQKASWSNFGTWITLAAPGLNIISTVPIHSFKLEPFGYNTSFPYMYLSGTSMATPYVSGVAALVASTSLGTSPQAIINRLETTADKISGTGTDWKYGRVDAAAAVGATPTPIATTNITPALFCVGGKGTPPCATIAPTAPTNAAPSGGGSSNPSTAPSSGVSPVVSGNPSVSNSPSGSPIAIGNPTGTVLPCPSQNQTSSLSTDSGATSISAHERHRKIHRQEGGLLSQFIKFLLQLILQLLQLIGINPCSPSSPGTPTPTITQTPSGTVSPSTIISPTPTTEPSPSTSPVTPSGEPTPTVFVSESPTSEVSQQPTSEEPSTAPSQSISPTGTGSGNGNKGIFRTLLTLILQLLQLLLSLLSKLFGGK